MVHVRRFAVLGAYAVFVLIPAVITPSVSAAGTARAHPVRESALGQRPYTATVLHDFSGSPDGAGPVYGVIAAPSGRLLGATVLGGTANRGAVFMLAPSGPSYQESVIYSFGGTPDGADPSGALWLAKYGGLFGTTSIGGSNDAGTVFKLKAARGKYQETFLYSFGSGPDGSSPQGGVVMDSTGAFYGTTYYGGLYGSGTAFKLTPVNGSYVESVIHDFRGGDDGENPSAGLVCDAKGNLYGTTTYGGGGGYGIIFALVPHGKTYVEDILYTFHGIGDGAYPTASLTLDASGALYGTTSYYGRGGGSGTVFMLSRKGGRYAFHLLYHFHATTGPDDPSSSLTPDGSGGFYGTSLSGGPANWGTVYHLYPTPRGYRAKILYAFSPPVNVRSPSGALIVDAHGTIYGTTEQSDMYGTVFALAK